MKQTINSIINLCKNHKNYDLANGEVKNNYFNFKNPFQYLQDLWFKLLDKMIVIDQNKIFEKLNDSIYFSMTSSNLLQSKE